VNCSVKDPANTNNSLSDDLGASERKSIKAAAEAAIKANYWSEVSIEPHQAGMRSARLA